MKTIRSFLTYILVILVILQCYSLLVMILPNRYFYLSILTVLFILFFCDRKIVINKNITVISIGYLMGMILLCTNKYFQSAEFICSCMIAFIMFFFYFSQTDNIFRVMDAYTNVMIAIAAISLFFFAFASLLDIIQPTGYYPYTQIGWGTVNYYDFYHLYCEGQYATILGYSGVRNISLFLEGPMLIYVLSFALYYELFLRRQGFRKWALIIFVLTIITSFSTTGLMVLVLLLYIKFYETIKNNKVFKFLFIPLVLLLACYAIVYILQDKFVNDIYSTSARTDDILASFKCFFHHMINGVGYHNLHGIDPYRLFYRPNAGLSTGLGGILAYGGLLWGIWFLIPAIVSIKNFIFNSQSRVAMAFVILSAALLFVTAVQSTVLCTMINALCWGLLINFMKLKWAYNITR